MKICPECKKENDDEAKFCGGCGRSLEDGIAAEASETEKPAVKACSVCGAVVSPDAKFCSKCGKQLIVMAEPLMENDSFIGRKELSLQFSGWRTSGICMIVMACISFILSAVSAWQNIVQQKDGEFLENGLLIIGAIILALGILALILYSKQVKNSMFSGAKHQKYVIYETGIFATYMDGDREISSEMVPYEFVMRLQRKEHVLAILVNSGNRILLLNMRNFTKGDGQQFIALLKTKCSSAAVKTLK